MIAISIMLITLGIYEHMLFWAFLFLGFLIFLGLYSNANDTGSAGEADSNAPID